MATRVILQYDIGIRDKIWNVLLSSYTNTKVVIKFKGYNNDFVSVSRGVGQERVLSALMLQIYIDGLLHELCKTNWGIKIADHHIPAILLADDTCLMSASKPDLQNLLNIVNNYANKWKLKYNGKKSLVIPFNRDKTVNNMKLRLGQCEIKYKNDIVYAGTVISNNKNTDICIDRASGKLKKSFYSLHDLGVTYGGIKPVSSALI